MTVRAATAADARGVAHVLVDGWRSTYEGILPPEFLASFNYDQHEAGARQHRENLPPSSAVFVAEQRSGEITAVAHVRTSEEGPRGFAAELDALYVFPTLQRQGIGSRLFHAAALWSTEHGHDALFLWVLRDNPYRRFDDRLGGELLPDPKQDEFGGVAVMSVAYGWRALDALILRLIPDPVPDP